MRFWTTVAAATLTILIAGCAQKAPEPRRVDASLIDPDCYTVDPYQPIRIADPNGVPADMRPFLGAWGGGAWDGEVCHDLWIMEISGQGVALMFDAHAPGFHPDATAFTRRGEIGEDGRLRVRKGRARVEYWIEDDGRLYGERRQGQNIQRIILTRKS